MRRLSGISWWLPAKWTQCFETTTPFDPSSGSRVLSQTQSKWQSRGYFHPQTFKDRTTSEQSHLKDVRLHPPIKAFFRDHVEWVFCTCFWRPLFPIPGGLLCSLSGHSDSPTASVQPTVLIWRAPQKILSLPCLSFALRQLGPVNPEISKGGRPPVLAQSQSSFF